MIYRLYTSVQSRQLGNQSFPTCLFTRWSVIVKLKKLYDDIVYECTDSYGTKVQEVFLKNINDCRSTHWTTDRTTDWFTDLPNNTIHVVVHGYRWYCSTSYTLTDCEKFICKEPRKRQIVRHHKKLLIPLKKHFVAISQRKLIMVSR